MKNVIITVGISGSGKSTWAKVFCQENPNWLRINRDEIRKSMLSVSLNEYHRWDKVAINRIETLVNEQQKTLLINALNQNWNVVIDNTHLKLSYLNEYRKLLTAHFEEFRIEYKLFDTSLEESTERDRNRADVVGEEIIKAQAEKLRMLKKNFKFESETVRRASFTVVQNEALPRCVLVDIDGTVAQMQGRYPFDWHRVGEDLPKWPVVRTVKALKNAGYKIIFFSGRDEICRADSMAWLCNYFEWRTADFQLFMRPVQDQRKDSDVKLDLFNQHVYDQYFVELVIDDRQQVVDMWRRKLGLTCLQVDYGDF
ncbi:MAG: 5'-hydroxyl kinase [Runella slithyformis]|nr:MAG: 5'-hydroxyl kinase [Runella slithyformis]